MSFKIPIAFHKKYLNYKVRKWIYWKPKQTPHILICGATGTGKTYLSRLILAKSGEYAKLYLCDFKRDTGFQAFENAKRYYCFEDCKKGLEEVYRLLISRQKGEEKEIEPIILYFDEWASYLNHCNKKQAEEEKKKLSNLLMMGRSFEIYIIVGVQRADAIYFQNARDNFGLRIGLGNLGEEAKNMLFHDFLKEIIPVKGKGVGYLIADAEFYQIQTPRITNIEKLEASLLKGLGGLKKE